MDLEEAVEVSEEMEALRLGVEVVTKEMEAIIMVPEEALVAMEEAISVVVVGRF